MAKGTVSSIGYHMLLPRFILRILGMFKLKFELSANAESCEDVFFEILYIQLMIHFHEQVNQLFTRQNPFLFHSYRQLSAIPIHLTNR